MAHWTEDNIKDFENRLSFDFITQLAKRMESLPLKKREFAEKLGLTAGRVSQIFNDPGNLTLKKMIEYAKVLGMKVAVVAYDDDDEKNERGPVTSEIFSNCWQKLGRPKDFWSIDNQVSKPVNMLGTASTNPASLTGLHSIVINAGFGQGEYIYTPLSDLQSTENNMTLRDAPANLTREEATHV